MRAGLACVCAAMLPACTTPTECERTGVCVTIAGEGLPVDAVPPLEVNANFRPPVGDPNAISSAFGPRWKQSDSRDDFHLGIDYFGEPGAPLLAIGGGTVFRTYLDGSATFPNGGNVVVVEHAIPETTFHGATVSKVYAVYLHCESLLVAEGDAVTPGQPIATMGKTGDTELVHLHFETRVETPCSLAYQRAHRGECDSGFDPHVHPFLFVGGANADALRVEQLERSSFVVRVSETRGDLDLDVIETDFGTLGFDERAGIDIDHLDAFDYGYMRLIAQPFLSTSEQRIFDLHFDSQPSFLELRDIYGRGVRF